MQGGFWSGLGGQGAELRPLTEALLPLVVTYANGSNGRQPEVRTTLALAR